MSRDIERPPLGGGVVVLLVVVVALGILLALQALSWVAGVFWTVVRLAIVVGLAYVIVRWLLSRTGRR